MGEVIKTVPEIKNAGFVYDPVVKGIDTSFWGSINGSVTQDSDGKLVFNEAGLASFVQIKNGTIKMAVEVPDALATSGDAKFGAYNVGTDTGFYFLFDGGVYSLVGVLKGVEIFSEVATFAGEDAEQVFEISWNEKGVTFKRAGVIEHTQAISVEMQEALAIFIQNEATNDLVVGYIEVLNSNGIVA